MFAVDREDTNAMPSRFVLHQFSCHDHRLFVGQGNLLSASDRRKGGHETGPTDDGGDDEFSFGCRGDPNQAFLPSQNFDRQSRTTLPEPGGSGGIR